MAIPQIRCFYHCSDKQQILVCDFLNKCPVCNLKLDALEVPPYCIPSPFYYHLDTIIKEGITNLPITPFSILVKPTVGNFLVTYTPGDDLHIALTDSQINIFSFDQRGVTTETRGWDCCLCISIIESLDYNAKLEEQWDATLAKSIRNNNWVFERYNEQTHNCYHYVITMLSEALKMIISKENFCLHHILPEALRAAGHISLYREIQDKSYVVRDIP